MGARDSITELNARAIRRSQELKDAKQLREVAKQELKIHDARAKYARKIFALRTRELKKAKEAFARAERALKTHPYAVRKYGRDHPFEALENTHE